MDPIKPLTTIFQTGSATSQSRERSQGEQAPAEGFQLKAVVLEASGNNRFILDIGGTRQTVQSTASLTPGQSLRLQVIRTAPQLELQIIAQPLSNLQGRSLTLLGQKIDLAGLLQNLKQQTPTLLASLSPASRTTLEGFADLQTNGVAGKDGGMVLRQLIDNLGLNLEQLLAKNEKNSAGQSLKAALLEVAHSLTKGDDLTAATHKILATLELFQLARFQLASDSYLILPLPLPFVEQGYLLIDQNDKKSSGNNSAETESRFSLHLSVTALGNLQVDFLRNKEGLFLRFRADSQEKVDFIADYAEELQKALADIPLIHLSFSKEAPDPIQELVRRLVPAGDSILDTRA